MILDMEVIAHNPCRYEIIYHKGRISGKTIQDLVYYKGLLFCFDEILTKRLYRNIPNYREKLSKILHLLMQSVTHKPSSAYTQKVKLTINKFKLYARDIYNKVNMFHNSPQNEV